MSTINKICLYAGNKRRLAAGWELCNGENGTPKIEPFLYSTYTYPDGEVEKFTIPYLCCVSDDASAYGPSETFLGQMVPFTGNFAPQGWAFCDGANLNIREYSAVFSLLGTMYGGDGMNTFALPKMKEIANSVQAGKPGLRYIICLEGIYPFR